MQVSFDDYDEGRRRTTKDDDGRRIKRTQDDDGLKMPTGVRALSKVDNLVSRVRQRDLASSVNG